MPGQDHVDLSGIRTGLVKPKLLDAVGDLGWDLLLRDTLSGKPAGCFAA